MCALYKLMALVALALSCRAELTVTPEECEPLTHTLPAAELDKIYGHWVLVAAFADFEAGQNMVGNISTSHLDLALHHDNQSVHFIENNRDLHGVCSMRDSDAAIVDKEGEALTLHIGEFEKEGGGHTTKHNASADVVFYKTCADCLVRGYKATFHGHESRGLFFYRREGHHILEADKLPLAQNFIKKQAECLKFLLDRHYMYDGKSELCTKQAPGHEEPAVPVEAAAHADA